MNDYIEQAKLALAEPGGESPPFIVKIEGFNASGFLSYIDSALSIPVIHHLPWKAKRMNKGQALHAVKFLIDHELAETAEVAGWREETEGFIVHWRPQWHIQNATVEIKR